MWLLKPGPDRVRELQCARPPLHTLLFVFLALPRASSLACHELPRDHQQSTFDLTSPCPPSPWSPEVTCGRGRQAVASQAREIGDDLNLDDHLAGCAEFCRAVLSGLHNSTLTRLHETLMSPPASQGFSCLFQHLAATGKCSLLAGPGDENVGTAAEPLVIGSGSRSKKDQEVCLAASSTELIVKLPTAEEAMDEDGPASSAVNSLAGALATVVKRSPAEDPYLLFATAALFLAVFALVFSALAIFLACYVTGMVRQVRLISAAREVALDPHDSEMISLRQDAESGLLGDANAAPHEHEGEYCRMDCFMDANSFGDRSPRSPAAPAALKSGKAQRVGQSLLAPVVSSFEAAAGGAAARSAQGEVIEASRESFVSGLEAFAECLNKLPGNMGSYLVRDIKKLHASKADSSLRGYREWLLSELPVHAATGYKGYLDDSAWMGNLWLGWTMEYFVEFIASLSEGRETKAAVDAAYKKSLYNHHSYLQRMAFNAAITQMPPRDQVIGGLVGTGTAEEAVQDMKDFVHFGRLLVAFCLKTNSELDARREAARKGKR